MKFLKLKFPPFLFIAFLFISCKTKQNTLSDYVVEDQELHNTIVAMDKTYFDAYNTCDLETQNFLYANDIEFYHDKGGLMTDKKELINALEKNICGKVTRELIQGSIEVYPIKDYGAVQIGYHKFHNKMEPNAIPKPSKFIIFWHNDTGAWKISKVVSLH